MEGTAEPPGSLDFNAKLLFTSAVRLVQKSIEACRSMRVAEWQLGIGALERSVSRAPLLTSGPQ